MFCTYHSICLLRCLINKYNSIIDVITRRLIWSSAEVAANVCSLLFKSMPVCLHGKRREPRPIFSLAHKQLIWRCESERWINSSHTLHRVWSTRANVWLQAPPKVSLRSETPLYKGSYMLTFTLVETLIKPPVNPAASRGRPHEKWTWSLAAEIRHC